jgi:phage tail-like protein
VAPEGEFAATTLAPAPPAEGLCGLAVTAHHYLFVGSAEPAGFLVFDLHAGGPPRRFEWPSAIAFAPFDVVATPDGGVCVLDREHCRFWSLDARFRVSNRDQELELLEPGELESFQPLAGGPERKRRARSFPLGVSLALATPIPAANPIAIEVLPDGTVLVLDEGGDGDGQVFSFRSGVEVGPPAALQIEAFLADGASFSHSLQPHDFAYLSASDTNPLGRLFVVTSEGNQAFAFNVDPRNGVLRLTPILKYWPMRLFQGKALVAAGSSVYYDHPGGFVPLVEQKRPRYVRRGMLTSPVFDGREPDCVWHRLLLDGRIPDGADVEVLTRASEDPAQIENLNFVTEPPLYRRGGGAELPFLSPAAIGDRDSYELLFQRARGRYLQIRLVLSGNGRETPRLRALRAWYPRFSYLGHYLPGVYQEDTTSASFIERFLANPEGLLTGIEDRIASAQCLFDVRSAPSETLEWLASWFGVALDPAWDETRRRLFIRHAMEFFQYRGTARGLRLALRLALDACVDERIFTDPDAPERSGVRIVERFRARSAPGVYSGDPTDAPGIRFVAPQRRWKPEQRREALEQRWRDTLQTLGLNAPESYPIRQPNGDLASAWLSFSRDTLGFAPVSTAADSGVWQDFLASRYRNVSALNAAYGAALTAFAQASLPDTLPSNGAPLVDWFQFEDIVQPMRQTAHRFRVLIPRPTGPSSDVDRAARLKLAERIVELEKPAHTSYEVRFFYALFRVGEARLGFDSLVDLGGRAPELMAPFVLGPAHLAEGYLAARSPQDARDRRILGRDRLQA